MKNSKQWVASGLALLMVACGDGNSVEDSSTISTLNANSTEYQSNSVLTPAPAVSRSANPDISNSVTTRKLDIVAKSTPSILSIAAKPSSKRPNFSAFTDGGQILRTIKTNFIKDNSWMVFYQSREESPILHVILLSPNENNGYQKVTIDSFNYEGSPAKVKEVFFTNIDKDPAKELIILTTWEVKHSGLGINAVEYQVSIYDNKLNPENNQVQPLRELMEKFGTGMDGIMEEGTESYQWKDKASILKGLKAFSTP